MTAPGLARPLTSRNGATLADHLIPVELRERAPAWARDGVLVLAGAALLILGGYLSFTVPAIQLGQIYVPVNEYVPLTLQTFGVLFIAALLGTARGVSATGLYLLIGIAGFPVFSADAEGVHRSGLQTIVSFADGHVVLGSTGGYLVGFLVASALVGLLAQRGWDRRLGSSVVAMLVGTLIIYLIGVTWLAVGYELSVGDALTFGLWPFVPGDLLKLLLAAGLLPLGWRFVERRASEPPGGTPDPA